MARDGQRSAHSPQFVHFTGSMTGLQINLLLSTGFLG
jgi:hypothetical protein